MARGLKAFQELSQPDMFFAIAKDQTVPVFFLREIEDALCVVEHSSPGNYRKKILCTILSGPCYGCERAAKEAFSGWVQKPRLYIDCVMGVNGLPVVMNQSFTASALTDQLFEHYNDNGTIRDTWFDVTKSGAGKKTKHRITPRTDIPVATLKTSTNLSKHINHIAYKHQADYLN